MRFTTATASDGRTSSVSVRWPGLTNICIFSPAPVVLTRAALYGCIFVSQSTRSSQLVQSTRRVLPQFRSDEREGAVAAIDERVSESYAQPYATIAPQALRPEFASGLVRH